MSDPVKIKYVNAAPNPADHDFVSVTIQPRPNRPSQMMTTLGGSYVTGDREVVFIANASHEQKFSFSQPEDAVATALGIAEQHGIEIVYVIDKWSTPKL